LFWLVISFGVAVGTSQSGGVSAIDVLFPIIGIGVVVSLYMVVGRAKTVDLVEDAFVVAGWKRTISIPIQDVEAVDGSRFTNPERMWLDLRRPSEFGSRIHFLPPQRWFHILSLHPLVAELRSIIEHGAAPGRQPIDQPAQRPLLQRVAIVAAGVFAFAAILLVAVMGSIKSSEPYQEALAAVRASGKARNQLGRTIEPGWFVVGSLHTGGDQGSAELEFRVSGDRSEGTVRLSASREAGAWTFSVLELHSDNRSLDLLDR
jgi:hypothetical protein